MVALNSENKLFTCQISFDNQIIHTANQLIVFRSPLDGTRIAPALRFKPHQLVKAFTKPEKTYEKYDKENILHETHSIANEVSRGAFGVTRRLTVLLGFPVLATMVQFPENALAMKQQLLAGRIPGLSPPDENGMRTYRRPDAKSGGHGVGWSPIIPYTFTVPEDWEEVPVSIADLGGTEIDLRFASQKEGRLTVVVAPVLRFADDDENTRIEDIGPPEKVIYAFGPELIGDNIEGKVRSAEVKEQSGRKYYQYELEAPHALITATAAGNRLYLMTVSASGLQWKKHSSNLKQIADSFRVD